MLLLFLVGILEMLIVSIWTKAVTDTKVMLSGFVTLINIMIWYYVLQTVIDNINDWEVVIMYALGCAIGTMISTLFFRLKENKTFLGSKALNAEIKVTQNN
jgi:uncharacterized protein YebE (UPF0316 family)